MPTLSSIMMFLIPVLVVGETNTEPSLKPFVPNPAIMIYFDELVTGARPITRDTLRQQLDPLLELVKGDKGEVLAQMAYQTALGSRSKKYNDDKLMICIGVANPIWEEMKKEERFEVLMRLLINHEDIVSQEAAWYYIMRYEEECCAELSLHIDLQGSIAGVCFEAFAAHIEGRLELPGPITTALVDYLIQRSPTASLRFLLPLSNTAPERQKIWIEVNQFVETYYREVRESYYRRGIQKRISASTKVAEDEVSRLAALYEGASWWQKIYLAEIIRYVPYLSSEKLVNSLKESKETLVLLSLEAARLEAAQDKVPQNSRWDILGDAKK